MIKGELVFCEGRRTGEMMALDESRAYTVGRRSSNDLAIQHDSVSRRHCRLEFDGSNFWIVDNGSFNGTHVNGRKVSRSALAHGDRVLIGMVQFRFSIQDDSQ